MNLKVKLNENVYFAYLKDLEYMVVAVGILASNLDGHMCRELYEEQFIQTVKRDNREIVEFLNTLKMGGMEFIEGLMVYHGEFTLSRYQQFLKEMSLDEFLYRFIGYQIPIEEIQKALDKESVLSEIFETESLQFTSFLGMKLMIEKKNELIDKFFQLVEQIKTPELENYLERCEKMLPRLQEDIEKLILIHNPIEVTEIITAKNYLNKPVYENHAFIPVFMLPRNAVTYYEKNEFVLYSETRIKERQEALSILKVLADETRIRIIDVLSERTRENGRSLSACLQLAPSTVSHHMEQLVECGIVREEKNGNAKYYSIQKENAEKLLIQLEGILLKNSK